MLQATLWVSSVSGMYDSLFELRLWQQYVPKDGGGRDGERERGENSNSNSKTLFYKDCSLGSVKNLSNN